MCIRERGQAQHREEKEGGTGAASPQPGLPGHALRAAGADLRVLPRAPPHRGSDGAQSGHPPGRTHQQSPRAGPCSNSLYDRKHCK